MTRAWLALALAGCGGPQPAPPIEHHASPSPCLPAAQDTGIAVVFTRGDGAIVCYGNDDGSTETPAITCFAIDAAAEITGTLRYDEARAAHEAQFDRREAPPIPPGMLEACADKTCKRFPSPYRPGIAVHALGLDAAGTHALVVAFPGGTTVGDEFADVIELATGKHTVHIKLNGLVKGAYFGDESMAHTGGFANRALLVGEWPAGPAGTAILVDPVRGVGRVVHGYGGDTLLVDDHSLLVLDGKDLTVVDTDRLTDTAHMRLPGEMTSDPEPALAAMLRLPRAVLVASAHPARLAVFDRATHVLAHAHPIPICANAAAVPDRLEDHPAQP